MLNEGMQLSSGVRSAERTTRKILSVAAWILLILVAVSALMSTRTIDQHIHGSGWTEWVNRIGIGLAFALVPVGLTVWVSALWHAAIATRRPSLPRPLLLALLLFGNMVAGFFYYWLYVHWLPRENQASRVS